MLRRFGARPADETARGFIGSYIQLCNDAAARLTALEQQVAEYQRDMPTIGIDPAGKGYPCDERPMTPAEAKRVIDDLTAQVAGEDVRLREAVERERQRCAEIAEADCAGTEDNHLETADRIATAIRKGGGV